MRVRGPVGLIAFGPLLLLFVGGPLVAGEKKARPKEVWTDAREASAQPDFVLQGEYVGACSDGRKMGCQVIALGQGAFQAVLLPGGLPGAGWDGKHKSLMDGTLSENLATFKASSGPHRYLAQKPAEFSATAKFPPVGQVNATANFVGGKLVVKTDDGTTCELSRTERTSPTMGAKAPAGAVVLFDGTNKDQWNGGRLDKTTGLLNTDGGDMTTRSKFNNYTVHLEFLLPYRPDARGQGRGNSGFYQVQHYELQILDSFGLDGKNNECGGFYTKAEPKVNMCLPPLVWQTYDIDFTNAKLDEDGKKAKNARATVRHNGVVIHDNQEISGPTGGHRNDKEGTPGPLLLQGHGNPLQFRNIWIVENK